MITFELLTLILVLWLVILAAIVENFRQACKSLTDRIEEALNRTTRSIEELDESVQDFLDSIKR